MAGAGGLSVELREIAEREYEPDREEDTRRDRCARACERYREQVPGDVQLSGREHWRGEDAVDLRRVGA